MATSPPANEAAPGAAHRPVGGDPRRVDIGSGPFSACPRRQVATQAGDDRRGQVAAGRPACRFSQRSAYG